MGEQPEYAARWSTHRLLSASAEHPDTGEEMDAPTQPEGGGEFFRM